MKTFVDGWIRLHFANGKIMVGDSKDKWTV